MTLVLRTMDDQSGNGSVMEGMSRMSLSETSSVHKVRKPPVDVVNIPFKTSRNVPVPTIHIDRIPIS